MASARRGRPKTDPDRDLRGDLLRASRGLLDEGGTAALSLREVARRAGCTHQAPYHYFADRETLLAALVVEGFRELGDGLAAANALAPTRGVRSTLFASGRAYIGFALSQSGVFRVMFRPDVCNPLRFPAVLEAGRRAHAELERLNRIVNGANADPTGATVMWAHVHGLACLLIDGPMAMAFYTDRQRQQHLDLVATRFADLLGVPPVEPAPMPRRQRRQSAS